MISRRDEQIRRALETKMLPNRRFIQTICYAEAIGLILAVDTAFIISPSGQNQAMLFVAAPSWLVLIPTRRRTQEPLFGRALTFVGAHYCLLLAISRAILRT